MKKVTLYQYSKCGTCRQTAKALKENGYTIDAVEIFEQPPDARTLSELIRKSGLPVQKFFNTSGDVYRQMSLKDQVGSMSDEAKIALLSSNGRLIKRPIVTDGETVTVGYKEEEFKQIWS